MPIHGRGQETPARACPAYALSVRRFSLWMKAHPMFGDSLLAGLLALFDGLLFLVGGRARTLRRRCRWISRVFGCASNIRRCSHCHGRGASSSEFESDCTDWMN